MRALLAGLLPGEGWVLGEWLRDVMPHGTLELVEVASMEAALDLVEHEPLEFCLLGANLGSPAVLRFLRSSRVAPSVLPTIVLASRADELLVVEALREGAYDYLLREELDREIVRRVARASARLGRALERERTARESGRLSEARFRALSEMVSEGLIVVGVDGRVQVCTPMASALIGASESPVGSSLEELADLFTDGRGESWTQELFPAAEAYTTGRPVTVHSVLPRGPSPAMALTARARPLFSGDSERPEVLMTLMPEERPGVNPSGLATHTAGIAHDLSNLLHAVQGGGDLLGRGLGPDHPMRALAEQIESAARSAAVLVRRLSDMAHDRPRGAPSLRLDDAVGSARGWMQLLAGPDVRVELHLQAPGAAIACDADELHRVLLNLITNAREAMPQGGRVRVTTRVPSPESAAQPGASASAGVVLEVNDSGAGMDTETQARAFQVKFTTKSSEHRGLGLATVREIVERLGGEANLISEPGKGASVTILLPRSVS
ncbi:MAG: ATP-binding protein [Acidobacteriota bacterium]